MQVDRSQRDEKRVLVFFFGISFIGRRALREILHCHKVFVPDLSTVVFHWVRGRGKGLRLPILADEEPVFSEGVVAS
jgi:hypothetical protein